ncbi:MAG: bifunctional transaldolase/phosoglucose isomerase [Anaerolineae bacterium]
MNDHARPSLWFEDFHRALIQTGALTDLYAKGFIGFSTDPVRLERAFGEGEAYDESINNHPESDPVTIYDTLIAEDARQAADLLLPSFDPLACRGVISIDVSLSRWEEPTELLNAARRLFKSIDRQNVLIKLPNHPETLTIIEEALFEGINVHITHTYAVAGYVQAAECYLRAIERRLLSNQSVANILSVVGFHVGSVDHVVDKQLHNNVRSAQARGEFTRVAINANSVGRAGLANAASAFRRYRDLFFGERFMRLKQSGAPLQRILWMDTGAPKPPSAPTLYLTSLTQPETILNVKPEMLNLVETTDFGVGEGSEWREAQETQSHLREVGIDLDLVARQLRGDSSDDHEMAVEKLLLRIDGKRKLLSAGFMRRQTLVLGQFQAPVETELKRLRAQKSITRTWARDGSLWTDSEREVEVIAARLGWLDFTNPEVIDRVRLAGLREVGRAYRYVVLLGIGASTIGAEAIWHIFGQQEGSPTLIVLDSTVPAAVRDVTTRILPELTRTLFVVASKSGLTVETLALQRYFYDLCASKSAEPNKQFIAITDPGSRLALEAQSLGFRDLFLNPSDVPARFGSLSYYGLVPTALVGIDVERILERGAEMATACAANVMGVNHPGLWLGTVMGVLSRRGLDKITLLASPEFVPFAEWAGQLIGDSTGKDDKGVIPISGGTIGLPHDYDDDRLLVYLRLDTSTDNPDQDIQLLQQAGHPLITYALRDIYDVGAEFFRWQFATAVAGMVLGVNPFNEPEVEESKRRIQALLDDYAAEGHLPVISPAFAEDGVSLYAERSMVQLLQNLRVQQGYREELLGMIAAFLKLARSGDYIGLIAFFAPRPEYVQALEDIRRRLRHTFSRAVTLGFAPHCLHTTGQLFKGGPDKGVLVQFTASEDDDVSIPEMPYTFGVLTAAQADGDMEALQARGRRIIRLDFGKDIQAGLAKFGAAIEAALEKRR